MKLRWMLPALGLCLLTASARAQVGIYLNPIVTHVSLSPADTGPFAFLGPGETSRNFGGVSLGGYYDFAHASRLGLGVDVRDELQHGNSALLNNFLVGARLFAKASSSRFEPYLELAGGAGTTHSHLNPARVTSGTFKVYVGADYKLGRYVDWRIAEVGYGSLSTVSSARFGGTTPISSAQLLSVSAGLVFHIR